MSGFAVTMRKYRVSEPAPSDIICLGESGSAERKALTRRSIAVVRIYVPGGISIASNQANKVFIPLLIMGYRLGIAP